MQLTETGTCCCSCRDGEQVLFAVGRPRWPEKKKEKQNLKFYNENSSLVVPSCVLLCNLKWALLPIFVANQRLPIRRRNLTLNSPLNKTNWWPIDHRLALTEGRFKLGKSRVCSLQVVTTNWPAGSSGLLCRVKLILDYEHSKGRRRSVWLAQSLSALPLLSFSFALAATAACFGLPQQVASVGTWDSQQRQLTRARVSSAQASFKPTSSSPVEFTLLLPAELMLSQKRGGMRRGNWQTVRLCVSRSVRVCDLVWSVHVGLICCSGLCLVQLNNQTMRQVRKVARKLQHLFPSRLFFVRQLQQQQ